MTPFEGREFLSSYEKNRQKILDKIKRTFFQPGVWMLTKKSRDVMMPWVERYKEFSGTGPVNIGGKEVDCDD